MSSTLKPSWRIERSMSGADSGSPPSMRICPAGVVIRIHGQLAGADVVDRAGDFEGLERQIPARRVEGAKR